MRCCPVTGVPDAAHRPIVRICGLAVMDFVFSVGEMPRAAEKYRADDVTIIGGGGGANAAVAVHRLGGIAHLKARLGDDEIGDMIAEGLVDEGLDTSALDRAAGGRSSFSSVLIDPAGERQIVNFRGADLTEQLDWLSDGPFDAVLVDTRWVAGALHLLEAARAAGKPGVVDAEAPVDPRIIAAASHIAFSEQGLRDLTGEDDPRAGLAALTTDNWACVTIGADGLLIKDRDGITHIPGFDVTAKDTLAAGDIWHGAFTLFMAEGQSEQEAARWANGAAAMKCTRLGGRAATPLRTELEDFMRERSQ